MMENIEVLLTLFLNEIFYDKTFIPYTLQLNSIWRRIVTIKNQEKRGEGAVCTVRQAARLISQDEKYILYKC